MFLYMQEYIAQNNPFESHNRRGINQQEKSVLTATGNKTIIKVVITTFLHMTL